MSRSASLRTPPNTNAYPKAYPHHEHAEKTQNENNDQSNTKAYPNQPNNDMKLRMASHRKNTKQKQS
jgi:hypothetical protein